MTTQPKYKWANPHEWFEQFARTKVEEGSSELYSLLTTLAEKLDGDQLQDLFQSDMDNDGYFAPEVQPNMECRACGLKGDDVQDFETTDTPGERFCPRCGSQDCYVIESRP